MTGRPTMTWRAAMVRAVLATVGRGRWWLTALATFLVRGGFLALLPAMLVLPTPAELAGHLDPSLTGDAPGTLTPALIQLAAEVLVVVTIALVATTAAGAWLEGGLVAAAAEDRELGPVSRPLDLPVGQAVVARLVAHLPTLAAVAAGGAALAGAAYAERVSPSSGDALGLRIASRAPWALVAIGVTWLIGETWGGVAVRRLALGASLGTALAGGLLDVVRPSGLATLGLSSAAVGLPLLVLWLATSNAYERLWPLVVDAADPWAVAIALGLLVGTWATGLWLLAIGLAFRSAAWTAEALRLTH